MRLAGGTTCNCGAKLVARSIWPERVHRVGQPPGLVVTETCEVGHVGSYSVESITMTELISATKALTESNRESSS